MMAFILATDFDFIAYMSKMAFFLEAFFTRMACLEYDFFSTPVFFQLTLSAQIVVATDTHRRAARASRAVEQSCTCKASTTRTPSTPHADFTCWWTDSLTSADCDRQQSRRQRFI